MSCAYCTPYITRILVPLSRDISSFQLYYYITQNIRFAAVFSSCNIIIRTFEYLYTYIRLCRFYFPFGLKIFFDIVRIRNAYYFDFKHVIVFCVHIILYIIIIITLCFSRNSTPRRHMCIYYYWVYYIMYNDII